MKTALFEYDCVPPPQASVPTSHVSHTRLRCCLFIFSMKTYPVFEVSLHGRAVCVSSVPNRRGRVRHFLQGLAVPLISVERKRADRHR